MKQFHILFLFIFVCFCAQAQNVTLDEASTVARHFFQMQDRAFAQLADVKTDGQDTLMFVFNADNGYVVISGDKRTVPVLAYSDHQRYNEADVIPPAKMWLDHYQSQLRDMRTCPSTATPYSAAWDRLYAGERSRSERSVEPLMRSHWGQGKFYNYYCPKDFAGENDRVVTGCVATAMAQLIYYFRFPDTGIGSYSYTDSTYGVQSADYGNTTYDYAAMCDEPTSINEAISTLMYHCGVGVDMVYGPDGSGMYNHSAARVLRTFFKYSPQTEYVFRDSTNLNWDSLIVLHLDKNIPLYYAGWSNPNVNGHGFICDGYQQYDSLYYYHFNFGWDGSYDNYFYTNALNLVGTHFNLAQELIVNAYPDTTLYTYPAVHPLMGHDTLTTPAGSFTDGSVETLPMQPHTDYSWTIRPEDNEHLNSISFSIRCDLGANDTLTLRTCQNPSEIHTLTDTAVNLSFNWACPEILVHLTTGAETSGIGFRANYNAVIEETCEAYQMYSGNSGSVSDGSETGNYTSFSNCRYNITLPKTKTLFLTFHHFDLEEGHDFLYLYNGKYDESALVAALTGQMSDTVIRIDNIRRLFCLFESDAHQNGSGFDFDYYGSETCVEDFSTDKSPIIAPNPVGEQLTIRALETIRSVKVLDMTGRVVRTSNADSQEVSLSMESCPSGMYLIHIQTDNNHYIKKIIKK